MKVVSWNVNSIRVRTERLVGVLQRHAPDVVCLQETKVIDDKFPLDELAACGYSAALYGQKTYNGVAILARQPITDVRLGLQDDHDDDQARLIAATVGGVRVISAYVPNGSAVGTDKYTYKQAWMKRLRAYLERFERPNQPLLLCGDFNVAPRRCDVAQPEQWEDTVLFHPEMRAALQEITQWGLVDVFAKLHPDGGLYSWWDYRMLGFPKNNGLRIDHVFATDALANKAVHASIDRDERKGVQPSDHAPVISRFELA